MTTAEKIKAIKHARDAYRATRDSLSLRLFVAECNRQITQLEKETPTS